MNSTASPRKKSPSSKAREIPLPRRKRTDPPFPALATDPRTWPARQRALRARRCYLRPQPPLSADHPLLPLVAAESVVREVMLALGLGVFPHRRWADWLGRRAEGLYRVNRRFRRLLDGPDDVPSCHRCMRNWLYVALHKSRWKYATLLPQEMHRGDSPLAHPIPARLRCRLPSACLRRLSG